MKQENENKPPRWAERFLSWYCRADLLEDLQGDLNEYFSRNLKSKGAFRARLIYIIDVLKFFRIYTIRKPEFIQLLIHWIMLGSYVKTSGRNIVRNKLFSAINIIGLAVSMCVGMLIIGMLNDVFSYDKFHVNHERIYRVTSRYENFDNRNSNYLATTSLKAAKLIEESFPQPEAVAILKNRLSGDVTWKDKTIPLSGFWANPAVLKVFSFQLEKGDPLTALKEPYSVVLTKESATKFFGGEDAIGKSVTFNNDTQLIVTGVLKDIPDFSTIKFNMLVSLATNEILTRDNENESKWDFVWSTYVYLLLPPNTNIDDLNNNLSTLSEGQNKTVENTRIELKLQAIDDVMSGESHNNEIGLMIGSTVITVFSSLAFVVILSACFNYTNLSIARSLKRTREIGIRKVIGARKTNLILQFVVESVIVSLFALILALALFSLLRSDFIGMERHMQATLKLELTPKLIFYFVLFALLTGVAAGIFPALFFSKLNVVRILKDSSDRSSGKLSLRKILIVFQYTISIIFICGTIAMYRQYEYFINYDMGFETANILNIPLQGNKPEVLKKALNELPEVQSISQSVLNPGLGNYWICWMKYSGTPQDSAAVNYNIVDENYLPQHDYKLLAGRNFSSRATDSVENEVIVNEKVLKRFNIGKQVPASAIDEILTVDGKEMRIIGVIKDFQYGKAMDPANGKEVIFRHSNSKAEILNVQIQSNDILKTYAKIQQVWKKYDNVHPFNGKFYSEQIEDAFEGLNASIKVGGFLAFLAVAIASLGLLGMVVFTTQTRIKEISIRKVLGAKDVTLLILLGKGFIIMLSIAIVIGFPITVLFIENVFFTHLGNHAALSLIEMFAGVGVILILALTMIFAQALKVTKLNPADVLKSE